ncbi:SAM-dependent methyltransferase [Streptomyces sp. NPDC004042]|uniref:O-methyltransferase n=1 Tax=Streptomyces sp. NPDC004042 TaxID=3154451 RepID=UPI0033B48C90
MSLRGTAAHTAAGPLPPLAGRAVAAVRAHGFAHSCRPEQSRLLHALAGCARGTAGETGTGCGAGLAWLASGAPTGIRLVSVERDPERARVAAGVFAGRPGTEVLVGDWRRIEEYGPYDLLVLDGGGQGKAPGGTLPRTCAGCSRPAARSSSTTSPRPPPGRPGTRARWAGPGCTGWSVPRRTPPKSGSRPA